MGNARRRWAGGSAVRLGLAAVLSVLLVLAGGAAALGQTGGAAAACKRGGWRHLTDVNGRGFANQGQCVRAAVRGRLGQPLNPQVTGAFSGTTDFEMLTHGCSFVFQVFDGTYSTPTGSGTFHIEGCIELVDFVVYPFSGSFSLTAPAGGTLSGSVSGEAEPVGEVILLDFTFTVAAATGSLNGATGTIHLLGDWDGNDPGAINGTLTGNLTPAQVRAGVRPDPPLPRTSAR